MAKYFVNAGNGESEVPRDFGDSRPKTPRRIMLLSPVRAVDGSVGIVFKELSMAKKDASKKAGLKEGEE